MSKEQNNRIQNSIKAKLIETGERERLRENLQEKLIKCGWTSEVTAQCRDIIKKQGVENVTVDELVEELVPKSQSLIPNEIKKSSSKALEHFLLNIMINKEF